MLADVLRPSMAGRPGARLGPSTFRAHMVAPSWIALPVSFVANVSAERCCLCQFFEFCADEHAMLLFKASSACELNRPAMLAQQLQTHLHPACGDIYKEPLLLLGYPKPQLSH